MYEENIMRWKKKSKILKPLWNKLYISREAYEKNGVETIVNKDGILWVNEKHVEEGLDHKNLRATTLKHLSNHRKHRYELVNEPKKAI